jgi:hypothetical protein
MHPTAVRLRSDVQEMIECLKRPIDVYETL